jgi:hypothetical protein
VVGWCYEAPGTLGTAIVELEVLWMCALEGCCQCGLALEQIRHGCECRGCWFGHGGDQSSEVELDEVTDTHFLCPHCVASSA